MATVLTESNTFSATVTGPDDGDARNAASVNSAFQSLANRTRRLLNAATGELRWNGRLRVGAAVAGLGVFVGPVQSLAIGTALLSQAGAETEVAGSLPLAGLSSWYGVYAYDNAGVLALQVSLDPRDETGVWKSTGLGTHRYLGSFRTDGAGAPIALSAVHGHYRWLTAPASRTALSAGSATAATSVACAAFAPPHARLLCLSTLAVETGASPATASLFETTTGAAQTILRAPASTSVSQSVELACTSAQAVAYLCSTVDVDLSLYVDGWRE
ncbi:MAG: hypothetical protein JWM10_1933 [Myxococcaceae bacterium]|nr:hypothetical protein [Myxococcaceae bacterium]